jgi:hypothetical protein
VCNACCRSSSSGYRTRLLLLSRSYSTCPIRVVFEGV